MSIVGPLWIVVIVGSIGTAALLAGAGVLVWLVRRAGSKKPQGQ
jgi:hypothetical protein